MYCNQCVDFSKKSQNDLNYHIAKKHNAPKPDVTFKCISHFQEVPGFYALRQHKNTKHVFPIKTANVDPHNIINEVDDGNLKVELRLCQHFMVNSELQRASHKVSIYAVETLNETIVNEKVGLFSNNSKGAEKQIWLLGSFRKRRRFQILLRTQKRNPAGPIESGVHHGRPGKAKKYSQQN